MKQQRGYIFRKGKFWFLRYADTVLRDGKATRVQLCKKLAEYSDEYRSEKSVRPLADQILLPINAGAQDVGSTMAVSAFIEGRFLPAVKAQWRPSTYKNDCDIYRLHVKPRLSLSFFQKKGQGDISLRNFRCCDGERLLGAVARQDKTKDGKPLGRNTLSRIKSFLSGVFKAAKRVGALDGVNPMTDTSIQGGTPPGVTGHYDLPQTRAILGLIPEPAKTIVLFAAFTGLRQGEIRGCRWQDFTGKALTVERSIWNSHINKPKTACSAAPIPIVKPLADALEKHRLRMGELAAPDLPIFQSGIGTPINLANVAKRVIRPRIEKCVKCRKSRAEHRPEAHLFELDRSLYWKGWHAFRRGLATTLHQLGTPDKEIQGILRHANVAITQASYIKHVSQSQQNALDMVAAEMAAGESCTNPATLPKGRVN